MNYLDRRAETIFGYLFPDSQFMEDRTLYRLYALLSYVKGKETTMSDVHDAWVAWKSIEAPNHRFNVPFDQLSGVIQEYDRVFMEAIHACS